MLATTNLLKYHIHPKCQNRKTGDKCFFRISVFLCVSVGKFNMTRRGTCERFIYWLVLEEASEAEGNQLEDRLQHKNESEDVVTDLQCFIQLLREMIKKSYRFIKCKSIHFNNSVKPALNFLSYSTMAICGFHYLSKCAEAAEKTNEMISPRCYLFHILMGKHWFKLNGLLCCLVLQLK